MTEHDQQSAAWWARAGEERTDHDPWRPPSEPAESSDGDRWSLQPPTAPAADDQVTRTGTGWPSTSPAPGGGLSAFGSGTSETVVLDTLGAPVGERRGRRRGALVAAAVVLALVAGGLGGVLGAWVQENREAGRSVQLTPAPVESEQRPAQSVAGVASRVLPSVVSITVRAGSSGDTGSGFVIDSSGYVLTNNHVVSAAVGGAGTISVELADGREEPATIVGRSQDYDLAVLKVDLRGLPALAMGNSDSVVVGDAVIAVGSPLGLSGTVTTGIISAEDRPVIAGDEQDSQSYINALQTDAAINPGNSGGPLVDSAGRVIGVNSAIASLGGGSPFGQVQTGSIGLGFAIPINQARNVAQQLIDTGTVRYPVIGVSIDRRFDGDGAKIFAGPTGAGPAVQPGGPADKAGLKPGDVIVRFDGRKVASGPELIVAIRTHRPGDVVSIGYVRGGDSERTVRLTLGGAVERLAR
jgi:putative serine protease PepD